MYVLDKSRIKYNETIADTNAVSLNSEFMSLYAKFCFLINNYNGVFDDEQTNRLKYLAKFLYNKFEDLYLENIQKLKIPSDKAKKISDALKQYKDDASDAIKALLANNDIKIAETISEIAQKLSDKSSELSSAVDLKISEIETALSASSTETPPPSSTTTSLSTTQDDVDNFASKLIDNISRKIKSDNALVRLDSAIEIFTTNFISFSRKLNTEAHKLDVDSKKQNRFVSQINRLNSKANSLIASLNNYLSRIIMRSKSIDTVVDVNVPIQAGVFRRRIEPIIRRIEREALRNSNLFRQVWYALQDRITIIVMRFKARINNKLGISIRILILDPLKNLMKRVGWWLLKNIIGLGILNYVQKAVSFGANIVKKAINGAFDLIEGTFKFAYNKVIVPIAKTTVKLLSLANKVFLKHFNNPLIAFIKTYPGAYMLGYVSGLIVYGIKKFFRNLTDVRESNEDKTFFELMRERVPFIDSVANWFVEKKNFIFGELEKSNTYRRIKALVGRIHDWWNRRDADGRTPKDKIVDFGKYLATSGVEMFKWLISKDFVSTVSRIVKNFKLVLDSVIPGSYRATKRAGNMMSAIGKVRGHGGWLGALLNLSSMAMLAGSLLFTVIHKPYVFEEDTKVGVREKYAKYFHLDKSDLSKSTISDELRNEVENNLRNIKDISDEEKKDILKYYGATASRAIYEAERIDDLVNRLSEVREMYDSDSVNDSLKKSLIETIMPLINEIRYEYLTNSENANEIISERVVKDLFNRETGKKKIVRQFNFLESILATRSSYVKKILNRLKNTHDPRETKNDIEKLLNIFKSNYSKLYSKSEINLNDEDVKNTVGYMFDSSETFSKLGSLMGIGGLLNYGDEYSEENQQNADFKKEEYINSFKLLGKNNNDKSVLAIDFPHISSETLNMLNSYGGEVGDFNSKELYWGNDEGKEAEKTRNARYFLLVKMLTMVHEKVMDDFKKLLNDLSDKNSVFSMAFSKELLRVFDVKYEKAFAEYFLRRNHYDKSIFEIENELFSKSIGAALDEMSSKNDDYEKIVKQLREYKISNGDRSYGIGEHGLNNSIFSNIESWMEENKLKMDKLSADEQMVFMALKEIVNTYKIKNEQYKWGIKNDVTENPIW